MYILSNSTFLITGWSLLLPSFSIFSFTSFPLSCLVKKKTDSSSLLPSVSLSFSLLLSIFICYLIFYSILSLISYLSELIPLFHFLLKKLRFFFNVMVFFKTDLVFSFFSFFLLFYHLVFVSRKTFFAWLVWLLYNFGLHIYCSH